MRQIRVTMMVVLVALVASLAIVPAAVAKGSPPGLPVQLSLGDSWGSGAGAPAGEGYVDLLHQALQEELDCRPARSPRARAGCEQLQLENLSVGGATTPTLIARQLPAAIELLERRNQDRNPRNDVELVTLHIGGNDVTNPIIAACLGGIDAACLTTIDQQFADLQADLHVVLAALLEAAGPATTIVIGTYDNPIPTCQLGAVEGASLLGAMVLEGSDAVPGAPIEDGLNDLIRAVAAEYDVLVAEVFGQLGASDWVGGNDCLHPSDYEPVADAFLDALGPG
jgi:lysophospholipase L1-like esterase